MNEQEHRRMRAVEDRNWWFVGKRMLVADLLRQAVGTAPLGRVLDVGCGTGATLAELARLGDAVGVDYSTAALRLTAARGVGRLCAGDAQRLGFIGGAFSVVTALDVLEHLDEPVAALREMARVCAPGGAVVLSVPAYPVLWSGHDVALAHRRRYTPRLLRQQVEAAGLEVVRLTHAYAPFVLPVLLVRRLRALIPGRKPDQADLGMASGLLNSLLIAYMRLEAALLRGTDLPLGTSLLCVARPVRRPTWQEQR